MAFPSRTTMSLIPFPHIFLPIVRKPSEGKMCGVYIKSNDTTGLAEKAEMFEL